MNSFRIYLRRKVGVRRYQHLLIMISNKQPRALIAAKYKVDRATVYRWVKKLKVPQ